MPGLCAFPAAEEQKRVPKSFYLFSGTQGKQDLQEKSASHWCCICITGRFLLANIGGFKAFWPCVRFWDGFLSVPIFILYDSGRIRCNQLTIGAGLRGVRPAAAYFFAFLRKEKGPSVEWSFSFGRSVGTWTRGLLTPSRTSRVLSNITSYWVIPHGPLEFQQFRAVKSGIGKKSLKHKRVSSTKSLLEIR